MSDFDKVRLNDWVRIRQSFAKEGPTHAYRVTFEGTVTDRDERTKLLRITADGQDMWVGTYPADPNITVELVGHRPVREVGWHEVARPGGDVAVRWWDGDEWRHGPTGPRSLQYSRSEYYLGTGSSR